MRSYSTRTSPLAAAAVGGRLPVYVDSLVYRAASTLRSSLAGGRLGVVVAVARHLPPVPGDVDQLEIAVVTVLVQAARSASDGGTMNVTARMRGLRVEIAVEDTGFGLPVEERHLGLTIVKAIVDGHGGDIAVEVQRGVGTRVALTLPVFTAASDAAVPLLCTRGE